MNGIGEIITNKYVLMGGVAIGVLLLVMSGSGGSGGGSGIDLEAFKIQSGNYQAELNTNTQLASIAAGVTKANTTANTQRTLAVLASMTTMAQSASLERVRQIESAAGVRNSLITSNTMLQLDRQQNANRIALARVGATVSMASFDRDIGVAKEQGATARYVAKKQANAQIWGSAIGAIAKIAPAAIAAI